MNKHKEQTILDIGCGTGEATNCLMQYLPFTKSVTAIDRSIEFIDYAREVNASPRITYECLNAEKDWPKEWREKFTMVGSLICSAHNFKMYFY